LLLPRSLAHIVAVYNLLSNFKCSAVEWSMQIIGCISFKVRVIRLSIRCRNECQGHKEIRHGNPNGHKSLPMSISDVLAMSDNESRTELQIQEKKTNAAVCLFILHFRRPSNQFRLTSSARQQRCVHKSWQSG